MIHFDLSICRFFPIFRIPQQNSIAILAKRINWRILLRFCFISCRKIGEGTHNNDRWTMCGKRDYDRIDDELKRRRNATNNSIRINRFNRNLFFENGNSMRISISASCLSLNSELVFFLFFRTHQNIPFYVEFLYLTHFFVFNFITKICKRF